MPGLLRIVKFLFAENMRGILMELLMDKTQLNVVK